MNDNESISMDDMLGFLESINYIVENDKLSTPCVHVVDNSYRVSEVETDIEPKNIVVSFSELTEILDQAKLGANIQDTETILKAIGKLLKKLTEHESKIKEIW